MPTDDNILRMKKVLVLDGDTLPALSIIRSLGAKGVHITTASHSKQSICGHSRYNQLSLCYPQPLNAADKFLQWIEQALSNDHYDLIIPVTERTLVPIARKFCNTPLAQKIAIPELDALETVLDKAKTSTLAKQCSVPIPISWDISTLDDLNNFESEFTYPLVIKPGRSISDNANRVAMTVRYAHSAEQLRKISNELLHHTHLVLQQYFTGIGVGIELIADQGEILYAFQHQRLHEMPLTGGGSSYRKSVDIDTGLLEASKKLVKALNWHGVAMVEFKKNTDTGQFILIEINGRFWGSLPLATAAGADFPYMLYQLYTAGSIVEPLPYKREVYCRKLSSDIRWLEAVLRKDADTRLVKIPSTASAFKDLLHIFLPRHYFDAQSLKDLKPGLIDLKKIIASYTGRLFDQLKEKKQVREILQINELSHIKPHLKRSEKILFLCYGNINRSAIADIIANQLMENQNRLNFKSAGFHFQGGRTADHRMSAIAEANGLETGNFRSTVLDTTLIEWADIIFVMECKHILQLEEQYTQSKGKAFLLGGLYQDNRAIEIGDPYNQPQAVYEDAFKKVAHCIHTMKKLLTKETS